MELAVAANCEAIITHNARDFVGARKFKPQVLSRSIDWRLARPKENAIQRIYFTDAEARTEVGIIVEALSDFPSVPKGSKGTVVKVKRYEKDRWAALVEWDLPRQSSFIAAMVFDASVNVLKRSEPVTDEFSKSEYEMLLRVLQPAN